MQLGPVAVSALYVAMPVVTAAFGLLAQRVSLRLGRAQTVVSCMALGIPVTFLFALDTPLWQQPAVLLPLWIVRTGTALVPCVSQARHLYPVCPSLAGSTAPASSSPPTHKPIAGLMNCFSALSKSILNDYAPKVACSRALLHHIHYWGPVCAGEPGLVEFYALSAEAGVEWLCIFGWMDHRWLWIQYYIFVYSSPADCSALCPAAAGGSLVLLVPRQEMRLAIDVVKNADTDAYVEQGDSGGTPHVAPPPDNLPVGLASVTGRPEPGMHERLLPGAG